MCDKPVTYKLYVTDVPLLYRLLTLEGGVDMAELCTFIMKCVRNFGEGAQQLNRLKWA